MTTIPSDHIRKPDGTKLVIRIGEDLEHLINRVTELLGVSKSEFCREAVRAGAQRELEEHDRQRRKLGFMFSPDQCTHPLAARQQFPVHQQCRVCGAVVRELL